MSTAASPSPRITPRLTPRLNPETLLCDLLKRYPQTRAVLNRYGLKRHGGSEGASESLHLFAQAHGVAEAQLLEELEGAMQTPKANAMSLRVKPNLADTIYRRYFVAGIAVILSVGAVWGAWLLWRIGTQGSFTGVSALEINAHGHAQVFGWVGLFIMGFALQAFPRVWQSTLPSPRLAALSFWLMLAGLALRTPAMAAAGVWPAGAWVAGVGAAMEIAAIALFIGLVMGVWARRRAAFQPYVAFIFAALGWFLIQAVYGTWHSHNLMTADSRGELIWLLSTYQAPLRDMQIHGLALCMVLGVSIRMLPTMFNLPTVSARRVWLGFGLITAALLSEVGFFLVYRWTGAHAWAGGLMLAWLMLAAGVVAVAWPWRLWRPMAVSDRSGKFVRAAYGWLAVSLVMLLLLPVYQVVSGIPFSHAYYGAIRHAITVGYVSLMIMGIAAKVVATLNGFDVRRLSALWGPFVLVNLGCTLRVSLQTLTDWHEMAFVFVGVSGILEVAGLSWWAAHLLSLMWRGRRGRAEEGEAAARPERILPEHRIAEVLAWFPQTEKVLASFGFSLIHRPSMRRSVARWVSLRQAAGMRGVELGPLLTALNRAAGTAAAPAVIRYDATLGQLVQQHPALAALLAALGVDPAGDADLTVEEMAFRLGWPRETLAMQLATAAMPESCSGRCESCDRHHGCEGAQGAAQ